MKYLGAIALCIPAFILPTMLLFSGPLHAFALLTIFNDKLGLAYWEIFILLGMILAFMLLRLSIRRNLPYDLLPALFISTSIIFSTFIIGAYIEIRRTLIIKDFSPDFEIRTSIFISFHKAPIEYSSFFHGIALKNCTPYIWSYKSMQFNELQSNTAVRLLPHSWFEKCSISKE